jgi:hypothetical protein
MYQIKPQQPSVTIFQRNGGHWCFNSLRELLGQFSYAWLNKNVGSNFRTFVGSTWQTAAGHHRLPLGVQQEEPCYWTTVYREFNFVMRDGEGRPVTYLTLPQLFGVRSTFKASRLSWNGTGPVPHTGRRHRRRHGQGVQFANALRTAVTFISEGEVPLRQKRGKALQVDWCDDYRNVDHNTRNWKDFRKTQWKFSKGLD